MLNSTERWKKTLNSDDFKNFEANFDIIIERAYKTAIKMRDPQDYAVIKNDLAMLFEENRGFFEPIKYQSVHAYGSRVTGLSAPGSDLDCLIQMDYNFPKKTLTDEEISEMVLKSKVMFERSGKFKVEEALSEIRYPICIIEHLETKTPMDVSFTGGLGVRNSIIINYWLSLQEPHARKLALFMRNLFDTTEFAEENFHKTLDMMTIFFLQSNNFLPSFYEIRKRGVNQPVFIEGIDTCFNENLKSAECYGKDKMKGYHFYIVDFFLFYKNFDFADKIVCPFIGEPVPKNPFEFERRYANQPFMKEHFKTLKRYSKEEDFVVLGFLDLDRNFAADVDNCAFRLKEFCENYLRYNADNMLGTYSRPPHQQFLLSISNKGTIKIGDMISVTLVDCNYELVRGEVIEILYEKNGEASHANVKTANGVLKLPIVKPTASSFFTM